MNHDRVLRLELDVEEHSNSFRGGHALPWHQLQLLQDFWIVFIDLL